MDLTFCVLALLPLGLLSLFVKGRHRHTAGFGFLAALAPVVAKGVSAIVKHKQQKSAEKKAAEYERQTAQAAEAERRAEFEAAQNSPQAAMQRLSFNMKLGKLLGAAGGRGKVPPSLLNAYDTARKVREYTPGASYVPRPTSGAGVWDVLGGATEALSYFDPSMLKRKSTGAPTTPTFASTPTAQPSQVRDYFRLRGSGTRDFG